MNFSNKLEGGLTVDKIIEKFIPVIGAICFIIGLGYLLYTSVWLNFGVELKLGLGFFVSLLLIGGGFSFGDRLKYFADVVIGGGILMLYGTLIYGSQVTESGVSIIPELATLIVACFVTLGTAYFASLRNSKVILALCILGSYLTPFVIGGEWGSSQISFNSYLIFFLIANISIFLVGKEIALRDLIPLNMMGLFFGTSSLYLLGYKTMTETNFLSSSTLSAILIAILVIFSVLSIVISAKKFESKEEGFLTVGYILPLLWFMINVSLLGREEIGMWGIIVLYCIIGIVYLLAWNYVRGLETRYQHVSLYVGGIIAFILAGIDIFPELNYISSTIIAHIGLIFAGLFIFNPKKWERFIIYLCFAIFGGFLGTYYFYTDWGTDMKNIGFIFVIISLIPSAVSYFVLQKTEGKVYNSLIHTAGITSLISIILMILATISDLIQFIDLLFVLGVLPAFGLVFTSAFSKNIASDQKAIFLHIGLLFLAFGFSAKFFYLISMLAPGAADGLSLATSSSIVINSIFALMILFTGLEVSRELQIEKKEKRPSFVLVVLSYTILLLLVNYCIIVGMNDLEVVQGVTGGPRAIATTIWWVALAGFMMSVGLKNGKMYNAEKLLGLILIVITVGKIVIYDMSTMGTDKKVIVLMIVGGILMSLSYFFHTKDWFKSDATSSLK